MGSGNILDLVPPSASTPYSLKYVEHACVLGSYLGLYGFTYGFISPGRGEIPRDLKTCSDGVVK